MLTAIYLSELGALLTLQSHYGPAGEFEPNWYDVPPKPWYLC
jgi:hypothetical protein